VERERVRKGDCWRKKERMKRFREKARKGERERKRNEIKV
jgi:hypothetical protein